MAVEGKKTAKTAQRPKKRQSKGKPPTPKKSLSIKLVSSLAGSSKYQREVVKGLGLRKLNSEVVRKDSPEIWGMIRKVPHMLKVEAVEKK